MEMTTWSDPTLGGKAPVNHATIAWCASRKIVSRMPVEYQVLRGRQAD